jgi:hypothetical protein
MGKPDGTRGTAVKRRGPRAEDIARDILATQGDKTIAGIYRVQVRTLRTRRFRLNSPQPSTAVEIFHTLLGVELKIGKRRLICPDLATARFLSVFARIGVDDVAVPYEITRISHLADGLESAWHQMIMQVEPACAGLSAQMKSKVRRLLIADQREQVIRCGAGPAIPQFNQNTKQRKTG